MQSSQKESSTNAKSNATRSRHYQERSVPNFLKKVFCILEENRHNDLLSWSTDGLAIVIKKPTELAESVLPQYFKHNNFQSFIRQLNMYKFKKRKSYHYDHVYSHDMFQRGKIDLLRNIQRKCHEMVPIEQGDMSESKDNCSSDVDQLLQENMYYKRVHKTLSTQMQFIESKMRELKGEVSSLYNEQIQSQANEDFLKKIIKALTKVYGFENIARVIDLDVEDSRDSTVPQESNMQCSYQEIQEPNQYDKRSLFELSNSSQGEEEPYIHDYYLPSSDCEQSEQFQNENGEPSEQYRIILSNLSNHTSVLPQLQLQEKNINQLLYSNGYEQSAESTKLANSQLHRKPIRDQEKKNPNSFVNNLNNYRVTDTMLNHPSRSRNQAF